MLQMNAQRGATFCDGFSRRDFLHAGALYTLGLTLQALFFQLAAGQAPPKRYINGFMLFLVGVPSHIDTWDPKPDAPVEVRGPFGVTQTNVPGIQISDIFP